MAINIAINGFGRIGRLVFRLAVLRPDINIVAINDLVPSDNLAYLCKYDSVHGPFKGQVESDEKALCVEGKSIAVYNEKDPAALPWQRLHVDYVVESTGLFTKRQDAAKHLTAGARRVIITAPASGDVPTFVMGVNQEQFDPKKDLIVSNASCTTNCLAPLTKVLLDNFGIEEGLMTTIHAVTASQPTVDGPSKKDWRGGRCASQNIIPASTGAATAVAKCLPAITGKLTGMAMRVPIADVSAVDLTVRLTTSTSYEMVCQAMRSAATGTMKGILSSISEPLVSSDFIGSPYSAIVDELAGIALNAHFYKLIAWYDNEMGYSHRVVDMIAYMAACE